MEGEAQVTLAHYPPSPARASSLDQIAGWIGQHPERTGFYAFMAARLMERECLCYRAVFDRCLRAATDAGLAEDCGRLWIYRGFAYAAAGHIEPPVELEEGGG